MEVVVVWSGINFARQVATRTKTIAEFLDVDEDIEDVHTHVRDVGEGEAVVRASLGMFQCSPLPVSIASRIGEVVIAEVERGGYPLRHSGRSFRTPD